MKVLVIEDEIKIAEAIESRLVKENYIIDKETDRLKGYYKACDNIYDLIILDIMLPNMNGFEILKNKVFYTIFLILVIIISLVMIPITIYYAYNQIKLTNEFMKMHNELNTKYIIIITLSSIVFSLSLLYLTSKKGFYKTKIN